MEIAMVIKPVRWLITPMAVVSNQLLGRDALGMHIQVGSQHRPL